MNNFDQFIEYLPFFIPLLIIEWGLLIAALIHIFRHPNYRFGNRVLWVIIVVLIQLIGPVVYFIFGRSDE